MGLKKELKDLPKLQFYKDLDLDLIISYRYRKEINKDKDKKLTGRRSKSKTDQIKNKVTRLMKTAPEAMSFAFLESS